MNYKILFLLIIFLNSCTQNNFKKSINKNTIKSFSIEGFSLIYNDKDYNEKKISKKLDNRSLLIFQKNLKKKTNVKIVNLLNGKSIIAKVSDNSKYPKFYNSVN